MAFVERKPFYDLVRLHAVARIVRFPFRSLRSTLHVLHLFACGVIDAIVVCIHERGVVREDRTLKYSFTAIFRHYAQNRNIADMNRSQLRHAQMNQIY